MPRLPFRLRVYIFGVAIVTVVAYVLCWQAWRIQALSWEELFLAFSLALIIAFAYQHPLRVAPQLNVQVETAAVFAALLIFRPPLAILISMVSVVVPLIVARRILLEILFNTSQTGLYVALSGTVYHTVAASSVFPDPVNILLAVIIAGVSSYLGNTLLVATAVGLQRGMNPVGVWRASWRYDISEHVALYLLGMLAALLVQHYFWALWLMAVPLAIVYISLQRSVHLRLQTKEAIEALADIVDMRDPYTFAHSKRVAEYAYELARAMKLPPQEVELITSAARVHDLGKVGIVEAVLNKPGKLDERQWEEMRRHPQMGAQIVSRFPYYTEGREFILHHHERMDGRGYPGRVSAEQLSIGTKIIAVADALDAMTSDRPYRKALPMDVVRQEFEKGSGTQWDARVVAQLLSILPNGPIIEDMPLPFAELATRLVGDESTLEREPG